MKRQDCRGDNDAVMVGDNDDDGEREKGLVRRDGTHPSSPAIGFCATGDIRGKKISKEKILPGKFRQKKT